MDDTKIEGPQKPMKLPRFSYQVPEDLTTDFLHAMKADLRETPSDLITAVLRRHLQQMMEEKMLRSFTEVPEDRRALPSYGPKPAKADVAPGRPNSAGVE